MNEEKILLKDLQDLFNNKSKYFIKKESGHVGVPPDEEGNQGEYNETFKFYRHPGLPEGIFLKETYVTDSYGYGNNLAAVTFVKGKEKTITVFEPIN